MYLQQILSKYTSPNRADTAYSFIYSHLSPILKKWGGIYLRDIFASGSSAKGTSINGKSDVDLFVSLYNEFPFTLKEMFISLEKYLMDVGFQVRRQNVSLGIIVYNYNVNIVPGKKDPGNNYYHKLYKSKKIHGFKQMLKIRFVIFKIQVVPNSYS